MGTKNFKQYLLVIIGAYPDIGKGILTASCAYLMQKQGLEVAPLKFDGYLNYNSGSMNPYHKTMDLLFEDEEVFVLNDGFEADADSGYYERFLGVKVSAEHNLTNGQLFSQILSKERSDEFSAGEILKLAHVRNQITTWLLKQICRADLAVLEVGGTLGDQECIILYDALRLLKHQAGVKVSILLLAPYFEPNRNNGLAKSNRTKLARQSFERATQIGLRPDILALRCKNIHHVSEEDLRYVASDCGIQGADICLVPDCYPVYALPAELARQSLDHQLNTLLDIDTSLTKRSDEGRLERYCKKRNTLGHDLPIQVGIFGRAVSQDSYVSLREAIEHAAVRESTSFVVVWLDEFAENQSDLLAKLSGLDALIVGEDMSYWKEKIEVLRFARTHSLPTLCISFGFDLAAIELATNVGGYQNAFLEEVESGNGLVKVGLTRLVTGGREWSLQAESKLTGLYNSNQIFERHRHQSWLSKELVEVLVDAGARDSGYDLDRSLVVFELPDHPFYVAVKFHPEYQSWPGEPSPPFIGLLQSAKQHHAHRNEYLTLHQVGAKEC